MIELPALLNVALIRKHYVPVDARTIRRWIASGKFPPADLADGGKVRLWRRETIERWINKQATGVLPVAV